MPSQKGCDSNETQFEDLRFQGTEVWRCGRLQENFSAAKAIDPLAGSLGQGNDHRPR